MAGFLFNLDSIESVESSFQKGCYSTKLSPAKNMAFQIHHEATLGDYATMRPGDNIYFFSKRNIYGIGEIVSLGDSEGSYSNFPNACSPKTSEVSFEAKKRLCDFGASLEQDHRWICFFKPAPFFFRDGIDMDDFLSSIPGAFRALRAFWKLSFIKLDDEENSAFKEVILRFNRASFKNPSSQNTFDSNWKEHVAAAEKKRASNPAEYALEVNSLLESCSDEGETSLRHEMAVEAALLYKLARNDKETVKIFGKLDFVHHQVVASPFKPIDYMDKIDVFGYSFLDVNYKVRDRILICEAKKDRGSREDVGQLMKYVDWVREEYARGDYSIIDAYLLAHDFEEGTSEYVKEFAKRISSVGRRSIRTNLWNSVNLIRYEYHSQTRDLRFIKVE